MNEKRYKWQKSAVPFTNSGDHWAVVIGADVSTTFAQESLFTVKDSGGAVIDSIVVDLVTVTAVGEEFLLVYLPRRLLVPPAGQVTGTGTPNLSIVICGNTPDGKDSLENALAL